MRNYTISGTAAVLFTVGFVAVQVVTVLAFAELEYGGVRSSAPVAA